nr:hypothetical protein CFP56_35533 [Quercus suber]
MLKAHEAISVDNLSPLGVRPSHELMSSHVHKVMQVLGESLYILGKYLDYEEKYAKAKSKINEALSKVEKAGLEAVEKFKASDEYLDKLCDYYVEGFDLLHKCLAKHHLELDFSKLHMEVVEKEVLVDRQSIKMVREGGEVATIDEAIDVDPSSSVLP